MRSHQAVTAYIALGANVGDRGANIRAALEQLSATPGIRVIRVSNLMENPAVGMGDDAAPFLNAAAELETTLAAHALLGRLLETERGLGRQRSTKWAPRTIDLDLLLYGQEILSSQELIVPHPLMHERRFVLQPLAEIAANVVHPTLQMSIQGLLEHLNSGRPQR